ncbi:hypothetical protein DFS34DRAFT_682486, partial [Phlyctochytrium arcticum]
MLSPANFPAANVAKPDFHSAAIDIIMADWEKDRNLVTKMLGDCDDSTTVTDALKQLGNVLNRRATESFSLAPLTDEAFQLLAKDPRAAKDMVELAKQIVADPFNLPPLFKQALSGDATAPFPTIAPASLAETTATAKGISGLRFTLYWIAHEIDNSPGVDAGDNRPGFERTLDAFKMIRGGDHLYADAMAVLVKKHLPAQSPPVVYVHYVGMTVRCDPSIRIGEHFDNLSEPTADTLTGMTRMKAFQMAAGDNLRAVHAFQLAQYDLPAVTTQEGRSGELVWSLRKHRAFLEMERLWRMVLYVPALNVAFGGLDHTFAPSPSTTAASDNAAT